MKSSAVFEQEARRVARELFPSGGGYGPVILDGRERDGVINDGETIHIIEATTNPQKRKANQDLEKSVQLKRELQRVYGGFNYRIWFITEKDPTPDQTAEADAARKKARCPPARAPRPHPAGSSCARCWQTRDNDPQNSSSSKTKSKGRQTETRQSRSRTRCTRSSEGDSFISSIQEFGFRQGDRGHPRGSGWIVHQAFCWSSRILSATSRKSIFWV